MPGSLVNPTVLAVHLRNDGVMGGCEQYRIRIPYEAVRNKVENTYLHWVPYGRLRQWAGEVDAKTKPTDYDIMVLVRHRPIPYGEDGTPGFEDVPKYVLDAAKSFGIKLEGKSHMLDVVRMLKSGKQCVVMEYDDDHWTGARDLGYYEHLPLVQEFLGLADALTVTTPYMRKIAQAYAPGVPVYVLPNCVKWEEWQGHSRWKRWNADDVILGLTGSITHYDDWYVLANVLPQILENHDNVKLLLQGFVPDYLSNLVRAFPHRVYADSKFRAYDKYPTVIRQADIVLCPVDPADDFNKAKSAIKAIEGCACGRKLSNGKSGGAAVIASPMDYYKRVLGHGKRGIIAEHNPDAWYKAITTMVREKGKRERFQSLGWKWVKKNRSIETQWRLWWNAYQEIYRRKR